MKATLKPFVPVSTVAHRTGLPVDWLRREAKDCRLPALKVGSRMFFNLAAVEAALFERMKREEADSG